MCFSNSISPEELHEHTNPSLLVKDENDGQHCNQSQHIEETTVYNEGLNRQEEEIIFFDEQNDISFEKHKKNEDVNEEILNQVVDIPFEKCHGHSLHGSFEEQFDRVLEKLSLEQPCHGKQIIGYFEGCHDAYDPMANFMENPCSDNGWLCVCRKDQVLCHTLFPL